MHVLKILSASPHLLLWSISARHPYIYGNALVCILINLTAVWCTSITLPSWRLRFCRKHPNFKLKPSYACLLEWYWVASFVLPARPKRNQGWLCWFVALCSVAPPSANWTLPAVSSWLRRPLSIWRPSDALSSQHLSTRSNGISDEIAWLKSMARFTSPLSSHQKRLWKSSPRFGFHCDSASQPSLPQSPPDLSPVPKSMVGPKPKTCQIKSNYTGARVGLQWYQLPNSL